MAEIDVVAITSAGYDQAGFNDRADRIAANKAPETGFVRGYTDVANLVAQVAALIQADPRHPCLRTLEINAHGYPLSIDGLYSFADLEDDTELLKSLPWCDVAHFYLAGCNTGLAKAREVPPWSGPIAKDVAEKMGYDAGSFAVHLTVYGTRGYSRGTRLGGGISCSATHTEYQFTPGLTWPWNWVTAVPSETYEGAADASGDQTWVSFKHGW